jgi:phosphoenolpyruvate-protein kinase (PTS system EI component)
MPLTPTVPDPGGCAVAGQARSGVSVVEGIGIGHAVVWAGDPAPRDLVGTVEEERARLARAIARAVEGVRALVRVLPAAEAELFEPEVAILAEIGPLLVEQVDKGVGAEDAVNQATGQVSTDLLIDVRARLLDGLAFDERSVAAHFEGRDGDRVLVTGTLSPSVVASLPAHVVGIVATLGDIAQPGFMSHAVILARGRDIPLAFVHGEVVSGVMDDDLLVMDTTSPGAALWIAPDEPLLALCHRKREAWTLARAKDDASVVASLGHLGLEVHVNINSLYERVPDSADGIGLLRTELLFSGHASAPSEREQVDALRRIASPLGKTPMVARLFDAGGDKPLRWLPAPEGHPGARGIELLLLHPGLLDAQLRVMGQIADHVDVRVLLPLVNSPGDVEQVRARTARKLPVGAMIETAGAVEQVEAIAAVSDFLCIGTNDLFAAVTGKSRTDSVLSLDPRVLRMIERVTQAGHARALKVSVCGEMAGDPRSARILVGLGVDAISVATVRFGKVKISLRDVTRADCEAVAREALS